MSEPPRVMLRKQASNTINWILKQRKKLENTLAKIQIYLQMTPLEILLQRPRLTTNKTCLSSSLNVEDPGFCYLWYRILHFKILEFPYRIWTRSYL